MIKPASANFGFLAASYAQLEGIAANAERDWSRDPVGCLMRLRLFAEMVAFKTATRLHLPVGSAQKFADVVEALERKGIAPEPVELLHAVRRRGNDAAHRGEGGADDALAALRQTWQLAVWYFRAFHDRAFTPPGFRKPEDPADTLARLQAELAAAQKRALDERSAAEAAKAEAEAARVAAEAQTLERLLAEERADKEAADRLVYEQMALELEQAAQAAPPAPDMAALIEGFLKQAAEAARKITVSEADVRRGIDAELRAAGWEADSVALTYAKGARPEAGVDRAVAEWPTADGAADYVLFLGLRTVAVIEAKRGLTSALDAIKQAERYSRGYVVKAHELPEGGPWDGHRVPLAFASNGRPYLRQIEQQTGVWMRDLRSPKNKARVLHGWPSPEGVKATLTADVVAAQAELKRSPVEALHLRGYQNEAILAVESALAAGRDTMLVAMATGTGKTRTAIGLIYRLVEAGRFRRVLFLVDRSALGEQTADVVKDYKVASEKTFAQIFGFKGLADASPDRDTKLHIATIQGMMRRVLDDDGPPPVDAYDCIVVDECHRGYTLDKEMSEVELTFRDQRDYVSRYRKVIDRFDAVKVGLTATPALHTTEIFGAPVFRYSYTRAVLDKVLVPQEPVLRVVTELAREGIRYAVGERVTTYDRATGEVELSDAPDELDFEVDDFNRSVRAAGFNRAVCAKLAEEIDPHLDEKTLVFCVDEAHAVQVTQMLKEALDARWGGVDDGLVMKITGRTDRALEQIKRFRNEREPSVVVTVDLLTTGVDVPRIGNLVFLRRVKSRVLYEQMLGRATRRCPEIGKESFRVYDAVGQTELVGDLTDMKPTVVSPRFTFVELARELTQTPDAKAREAVHEQLVTKLRRKRTALERAATAEFMEAAGGLSPSALLEKVAAQTPAETAAWLVEHPVAVGLMDRASGYDARVVLHEGDDRVVEFGQDFNGRTPGDYLDEFGAFVEANMNRIPALMVVKTAPRDLTRKQLRELAEALDAAGYSEINLRTAWHRLSNEDVAASIVGYIRQRALGEPLKPYRERVERAVKRVLASRAWNKPQRSWLERIGKQVAVTTVVDREALDEEPFRDHGGFEHLDAVFDGKAEEVLAALRAEVWSDAG